MLPRSHEFRDLPIQHHSKLKLELTAEIKIYMMEKINLK